MQVNEALIRYKPTSTPTYTTLQVNDTNAYSDIDTLYHKSKVEDRKPTNANDTNGCRVVEDINPTTTTINGHGGEGYAAGSVYDALLMVSADAKDKRYRLMNQVIKARISGRKVFVSLDYAMYHQHVNPRLKRRF